MYVSADTTPSMATLTLTNDYSIVLGEFFYVDNVRDDLNGTQTPVNIWLSASTATEIDGTISPPALASHVVTLHTLTAHNYQGQLITVDGITQAAFNGTHHHGAERHHGQYTFASTGPTTGTVSGAHINATPDSRMRPLPWLIPSRRRSGSDLAGDSGTTSASGFSDRHHGGSTDAEDDQRG
jgi:hypothetical protein